MGPMWPAMEINTFTILPQTSLTVRNGMTTPMKLASKRPTIIRIIEVMAFFAANPKMKPSARSNTIPRIPATEPGTKAVND